MLSILGNIISAEFGRPSGKDKLPIGCAHGRSANFFAPGQQGLRAYTSGGIEANMTLTDDVIALAQLRAEDLRFARRRWRAFRSSTGWLAEVPGSRSRLRRRCAYLLRRSRVSFGVAAAGSRRGRGRFECHGDLGELRRYRRQDRAGCGCCVARRLLSAKIKAG